MKVPTPGLPGHGSAGLGEWWAVLWAGPSGMTPNSAQCPAPLCTGFQRGLIVGCTNKLVTVEGHEESREWNGDEASAAVVLARLSRTV